MFKLFRKNGPSHGKRTCYHRISNFHEAKNNVNKNTEVKGGLDYPIVTWEIGRHIPLIPIIHIVSSMRYAALLTIKRLPHPPIVYT